MQVQCGGVGVLLIFSSYTQESKNAAAVPKFNNQIPSQKQSSTSMWRYWSKNSAWSYYTTFDISLPWYYWINCCDSTAGWASASGSFHWGFVDLQWIFQCWDRRQYQMMCNSSWNRIERRRFSFDPAKECTKEWKCMCWLLSLCLQPIAFSHKDK